MPLLRHLFFPVLGCSLFLAGCAPYPLSVDVRMPPLLSDVQPSNRADVTFAFLSLEQAMRHDDVSALLNATNVLLQREPSSRPLADAAGWLLGNRYMQEARQLLEKAAKALPDDLPLHIMLAETLLEEEHAEEAERLLQGYAMAHPNESAVQMELALFYLKMEKYAKALALLEGLPSTERNPSVNYYHAQTLRALGRLDAAAAMLRTALAEAPDFLEGILELAMVEEQRENYAEAARLYKKLLSYDEGNQDILLRLMVVALKRGNPQEAARIAVSVPDSLGFTLTAANLFMDDGRYDLAEELLAFMAQKNGNREELIFYQAAVAYEGRHDTARALNFLDSLGPSPRFLDKVLKLRIQIFYETDQLEQALATVHDAKQAYPADQGFRLAEMELLTRAGRHQEALTAAEQAMADWPDDSDIAFHHAFMVDQQGDKARALELMEDIISKAPDNAQALNYVGYTLAEENRDLERALQLLTKAVKLSPETDFILDSLAWAQYRLGLFQEAWQTISHALSLSPNNGQDPTMWEHYGDIAHAAGLPDEARKGWAKALELHPANAAAIHAKLERL